MRGMSARRAKSASKAKPGPRAAAKAKKPVAKAKKPTAANAKKTSAAKAKKPAVKAKKPAVKAKKPAVKAKKPAVKAKKPAAAKAKKPVAKVMPAASRAERPAASVDPFAPRFERGLYDLPVMDLREAVALASALVECASTEAGSAVHEECARLELARERAAAVLSMDGPEASPDARAFDVAMDRAWATVVGRIQDHAELRVDLYPHAVDAAKVYAVVEDLSILKLNYLAEFAQIGARLDSLKREGLLADARSLAGEVFVDEVLRCHGEYGAALGALDAGGDGPPVIDHGRARNGLTEAIGEYVTQVLAEARPGHDDAWSRAESTLAPLLELRDRQSEAVRAAPRVVAPPAHPPVMPQSVE